MKQFTAPLLSLLALAGCASTPASDTPATPPPVQVTQEFCPQVQRLAQADSLTTFLPGRSDVAAQITTAQITGVAGSCELVKKKTAVDVKFQAGFAASNGPANQGQPITLPYFIAITLNDQIIQENYYTITLNFNGNASTAEGTSKPATVEVPNMPGAAQIQILVGFQGSPAQLNYAATHPVLGQ